MSDDIIITRILGRGLLDIRIASAESNNKAAFSIADFLHQVPYQIERIINTGGNYSDILDFLKDRANIKNMNVWLEHVLNEINQG